MACINFPSPVFGPIKSRRLGTSLGINLLPEERKICSFDCIYCEVGLRSRSAVKNKLPTREKVREVLERKLQKLKEDGEQIDVFTFAGNGEPTSHPDFENIIDDTIELRDKYYPEAKITVLSNATFLKRPGVIRALKKIDNNIQKIDTVDPEYIKLVNNPNAKYDIQKVVEQLKEFNGDVIVQTIFMGGNINGIDVDNTSDKYVLPWLEAVKKIKPKEVMIYTLARETPVPTLEKATKEQLDRIGQKVRDLGIPVQVTY
ncbi:MAG: radical SAM protein [Burkholderiales bacterium]|nr:radical SAM protein [Burkholderiales bacterium]